MSDLNEVKFFREQIESRFADNYRCSGCLAKPTKLQTVLRGCTLAVLGLARVRNVLVSDGSAMYDG